MDEEAAGDLKESLIKGARARCQRQRFALVCVPHRDDRRRSVWCGSFGGPSVFSTASVCTTRALESVLTCTDSPSRPPPPSAG